MPDSSLLSLAVEEQISEASEKAHRNPSANNLGNLGVVFHSSANYSQAAQCYQLAIEKSNSDWKWNHYLGYIYMELGEPERVVENFNKVIDINPNIGLAWYYLGEAYRSVRKTDLAEKAFSRIISDSNTPGVKETTRNDHFPIGVYAMFQLSKIYFETGRPELAEETIKKLLRQNDLFGPAFRLLGNIYTMKGDISSGENYTIRANDLLLFSPPVDTLADKLALMSRSELYLLKNIDDAARNSYSDWTLQLIEQGFKYIPDNEYLISKAIEVYLLKKQNQKASELMGRHLNAFSADYNELVSMGSLFFKNEMYYEAIIYWRKALNLSPEDVDIYKNMSSCYWKTGDKQKNEEILTEAAEMNQDNPEKLADIIFTFIQFEHIDKANQYLKKLKQPSPQTPKIQKLYGKIAERNGDLMDAINKYESSFKGDQKDLETINELGNLLMSNEMWNKYLAFYQEALKFNPNNPEYLNILSKFYLGSPDKSLRNLDESIKYSIRAFSNKNSTQEIILSSGKNLAVALANRGDKQNALNTIIKTINISQRTNASQNEKQELEILYRTIQNL
jgi:tetratricopeptide (TPR) repeat protein